MDSNKVNSFGGKQPKRRDDRYFGGHKAAEEKPVTIEENKESSEDIHEAVFAEFGHVTFGEPIEPIEPFESLEQDEVKTDEVVEEPVEEKPEEEPVEEKPEETPVFKEKPEAAEPVAEEKPEAKPEEPAIPEEKPKALKQGEGPVIVFNSEDKKPSMAIDTIEKPYIRSEDPKLAAAQKNSNTKMTIAIIVGFVLLLACAVGMVIMLNGINTAGNKIESINDNRKPSSAEERQDEEAEEEKQPTTNDDKGDEDEPQNDDKKDEEDKDYYTEEKITERNDIRASQLGTIAQAINDYIDKNRGVTPFEKRTMAKFTKDYIDDECEYSSDADNMLSKCGKKFQDPDGTIMSWAVPNIATVSDQNAQLSIIDATRVNHRIYSIQSARCGADAGTYSYVDGVANVALLYVGEQNVIICRDNY